MAESEAGPFNGVSPEPIKVDETVRLEALRRARAGEALTRAELRALLRVSESTFLRQQRAGRYDAFRIHPQIGPPRYAGLKVAKYLDGEGVRDTDRVFGRKRAG